MRCNNELVYSIPRQEGDNTTKARIEAGYYYCNTCTEAVKAKKKQEREERKQAKKQKKENIKHLEETKVQTFDRQWRDVDEDGNLLHTKDADGVEIVNLPEHRRLMWGYITSDIRKSEAGFKTDEEDKVIRRSQIRFVVETAMNRKQEVDSAVSREEIDRKVGDEQIAEIETWKKTELKRQTNYVEKLHAKANKEWEDKPETEVERMVKEPGYRDPEGNKAPRYHLLSQESVFHKRQALRNRRIDNIQRVDKLEEKISEKNEKLVFDENQGQTTT